MLRGNHLKLSTGTGRLLAGWRAKVVYHGGLWAVIYETLGEPTVPAGGADAQYPQE